MDMAWCPECKLVYTDMGVHAENGCTEQVRYAGFFFNDKGEALHHAQHQPNVSLFKGLTHSRHPTQSTQYCPKARYSEEQAHKHNPDLV